MNMTASEMNSVIDNLASKLGITTSEVMGYYIAQAPTKWLPAIATLISLVLALIISKFIQRIETNEEEAEKAKDWFKYFNLIVIGFGLFIAILTSIPAIKAMMAPKAYALTQILSNF